MGKNATRDEVVHSEPLWGGLSQRIDNQRGCTSDEADQEISADISFVFTGEFWPKIVANNIRVSVSGGPSAPTPPLALAHRPNRRLVADRADIVPSDAIDSPYSSRANRHGESSRRNRSSSLPQTPFIQEDEIFGADAPIALFENPVGGANVERWSEVGRHGHHGRFSGRFLWGKEMVVRSICAGRIVSFWNHYVDVVISGSPSRLELMANNGLER